MTCIIVTVNRLEYVKYPEEVSHDIDEQEIAASNELMEKKFLQEYLKQKQPEHPDRAKDIPSQR